MEWGKIELKMIYEEVINLHFFVVVLYASSYK